MFQNVHKHYECCMKIILNTYFIQNTLHNCSFRLLVTKEWNADIIRTLKSRRLWWAEHVARMGDERRAHKLFIGKQKGKRTRDRPKIRWEDNII